MVAFGNNRHRAKEPSTTRILISAPQLNSLWLNILGVLFSYGLVGPFCVCFADSSHDSMITPFYEWKKLKLIEVK